MGKEQPHKTGGHPNHSSICDSFIVRYPGFDMFLRGAHDPPLLNLRAAGSPSAAPPRNKKNNICIRIFLKPNAVLGGAYATPLSSVDTIHINLMI